MVHFFFFFLLLQGEVGGSLSKIAAQGWDQDSWYSVGGDQIIRAGYSQLPAYLARGLNVSLGCAVSRVDTSAVPVKVTASCSSGVRVFTGDAVLVTLPLGVLKANVVTFVPALPAAKLQAIGRMAMG